MSTQYDTIGNRHKTLEGSPIGEVDYATTTHVLNLHPIPGLKVLDLACGIGRWSRYLVEQGADQVVGIDISEGMIRGAEEMKRELNREMGDKMSFAVKDCGKAFVIGDGEEFDLVLGAWYLSYAPDYETLVTMFRNVHNNLAPIGRFVATVPNAFCPMFETNDMYGVTAEPLKLVAEGCWKTRLTAHLEGGDFGFEYYHRLHKLYEKAAREAGMGEITWHPYVLPRDERSEGQSWDKFKLRPHLAMLECWRK